MILHPQVPTVDGDSVWQRSLWSISGAFINQLEKLLWVIWNTLHLSAMCECAALKCTSLVFEYKSLKWWLNFCLMWRCRQLPINFWSQTLLANTMSFTSSFPEFSVSEQFCREWSFSSMGFPCKSLAALRYSCQEIDILATLATLLVFMLSMLHFRYF